MSVSWPVAICMARSSDLLCVCCRPSNALEIESAKLPPFLEPCAAPVPPVPSREGKLIGWIPPEPEIGEMEDIYSPLFPETQCCFVRITGPIDRLDVGLVTTLRQDQVG